MSLLISRRKINETLKNAALAMALIPFRASKIFAQPNSNLRAWHSYPFALGVASGMPRPNSVLLWTRILIEESDYESAEGVGEPLTVSWELFDDETLKNCIRRGQVLTDRARGHAVHVKVEGLNAATNYWYRFNVGDAVSSTGQTKTAPEPNQNVQSMRFALASCQNYEAGEYTAYEDMLTKNLDFVLFVGDYIYESNTSQPNSKRTHTGAEPQNLDHYRARYAQYKKDPFLQAAHAKYPWILMWDDHEVVNDYANDLDPAYSGVEAFLKRRAAAYRAYFEHQPIEIGPLLQSSYESSMNLNDSYSWGQLAQLWTMDCRQYRSHHACSSPGKGGGRVLMSCDELEDPNRTMFGFDQEVWLSKGLQESKKLWKFVAQTTEISSTRISSPFGKLTYTDAWDGYPQARRRFLEDLRRTNANNVVALGGDVHMNVAANLRLVPNDPASPIVASEFVTTSITSPGLGQSSTGLIKASNSDILHMQANERGYALINADALRVTCEFRTTPHPAQIGAPFKEQAAYTVETGSAGPKIRSDST